jgi:hypothetical protein
VTCFPHVEQAAVHKLQIQHSTDTALHAAFSVQSDSLVGTEPRIGYIQNACFYNLFQSKTFFTVAFLCFLQPLKVNCGAVL